MQVKEIQDKDVICHVKNSATLAGPLFTAHASQVHIDLPTLTEVDKEVLFKRDLVAVVAILRGIDFPEFDIMFMDTIFIYGEYISKYFEI